MFAVIETGSKQYKTKVGDLLSVEKVKGEPGSEIVLNQVLLIQDKSLTLGTPFIKSAGVLCEVVDQIREPKILIYKYKRRKGYRRKKGHRQAQTVLKVKKISLSGVTASKTVAAKKSAAKKPVEKKKSTAKKTTTTKKGK